MLGGTHFHHLNSRNCTLERHVPAHTHHHWALFWEREKKMLHFSELCDKHFIILWTGCNESQNQLNFVNVSFHWLFPKLQISKSLRSPLVLAVYRGSFHVVHMYYKALKFKLSLITGSSDSFQVCFADTLLWQALSQRWWPKAEKKVGALPGSLCMYNCPPALRSTAQACR